MSRSPDIRIVVDAMGGDKAPEHIVEGAVDAFRESSGRFTLVLVGQEERVRAVMNKLAVPSGERWAEGFLVVDAPEVIEMDEPPNTALKAKRKSSIAVGLTLQKEGKADAFLSAGNTGAVLSASTLILGRLKGVARPTIGALFPTAGSPCFVTDAGANVDCKPRHLYEFGVMGSLYVSSLVGKKNPSIGLLSVGEEATKGNEVTLAAGELFRRSSLNFVGNVEGRDILSGRIDVVVCDGFVGNILLKFGESVPGFLKSRLKQYAESGFLKKIRLGMAQGGLRQVMRNLDYQEHGGVPLLGVNGVSIIGHGGSTPKAIKNMIYRAEEMVRWKLNLKIEEAMGEAV
ncbi:MAG: phosphate acyltransferase PlsX [Ignavibacteria bacterium]|nr:phosphate acyltransferase PlsX [Ignavibacteria bacterium]